MSRLLVLLFGVFSVGEATAEGFSIEVGVVHTRADTVELGGHSLDQPSPPTLRSSFSGTSFRIGGAYAIDERYSVELGFARLATVDKYNAHFVEFVCPGVCAPGEGIIVDNVEQSGHGQWLALVATKPLGPVNLSGKIGISHTVIESAQQSDRTNRRKVSDTSYLLGVAVAYPLSEKMSLQFGVDALGDSATQVGVGLSLEL